MIIPTYVCMSLGFNSSANAVVLTVLLEDSITDCIASRVPLPIDSLGKDNSQHAYVILNSV